MKKESTDPINQVVELILVQAGKFKASEIDIHTDGAKTSISYLISGKWSDQEPTPQYLWDNLKNIFIRKAGGDYWKKDNFKGLIKDRYGVDEWDFEISEDHKKIRMKSRTNGVS